ncbi:hypothetical protein [Miltoncostaea marina]|uniref:hypothetical protein n=1 Tax=Miltoncostaea marina TaxID=2843215 RepID=UPI001C3C3D6D|nr:hypothetical protein [Miltoncostaea marina]
MSRRAGRAAAAAAAACLLAAGCGGDGDAAPPGDAATAPATTAAATAPAVPRPAGFPDGGERFLLARLEPRLARLCGRAPAASRSAGAVAALACRSAGELGAAARFELFPARAALVAAYGRLRAANGVPVASGQCVPAGGGGRVPADGPWGFGSGRDEGRVMCFRAGGVVRVVTTVERIRTLAWTAAPRFGDAVRFWRGPGIPSLRPPG